MNDFPYEDAAMPYSPESATETSTSVEHVRENHEKELMAIAGVEGVGVGRNSIGDDAIVVYLRTEDIKSQIPPIIDGYPVETRVTGIIDAL
jgi:hypothetical protein